MMTRRVGSLISRVIKDPKTGFTRCDANRWANLEEADSKWADPYIAAIYMDIVLPELPQQPPDAGQTQTLGPKR